MHLTCLIIINHVKSCEQACLEQDYKPCPFNKQDRIHMLIGMSKDRILYLPLDYMIKMVGFSIINVHKFTIHCV